MSEIKSMYYKIVVNGKELDEKRYSMIQSVKHEDCSSGSDLVTITIDDPDLEFLQDSIFVNDAPVKFTGGWYKGKTFTFEGYISVIDVTFPNSGTPQVTIHCMDNTHLMNRTKRQKTWKNMKVSDIAKQIFKSYGFSYKVDDTGTKEESTSQNDTDIRFLTQLADNEYEDYIVYVEGRKGYFIKKPSLGKQQAQLDYRCGNGELQSFSPRINKQTKRLEVGKSNVNLKDKKVDRAITNDSVSRPQSGTSFVPTEKPVVNKAWVYNSKTNKWTLK